MAEMESQAAANEELAIVTDSNFQTEVLGGDGYVLVDFYADWCGPCRFSMKAFIELKKKVGTKMKVVKVNVDDSTQTAIQWNVRSVPTIILYKDGKMVATSIGAKTLQQLESFLESNGAPLQD